MHASRQSIVKLSSALAGSVLVGSLAGCGLPTGGGASGEDFPATTVEIIVPAAAGGGWDSTARAMQEVAQDEDLVDEPVEVFNLEGSPLGLAQLQEERGNPHALMMTGLVAIGALELADSELSLEDTTPIAVLTSEAEAFVVPEASPFRSIQDVVTAYLKDPKSVTFGGGSAGGSDQLVAAELLRAAGGDAGAMTYVGYSGGGEAIAGILSGDVEVGVSGISEFIPQIEAGDMRLLAVSTPDPVEVGGNKETMTLQEAGYDVNFVNWRAIVAAPGLTEERRVQVTELVDRIHGSAAWQRVLEENGWTDYYKTGDEAEEFIRGETEKTARLYEDLGL